MPPGSTEPPRRIESIVAAVGRTPLIRLPALERAGGPRLFAKCEFLGPGGSIFDRAAAHVLARARLVEGTPLLAAGGTDAVISLALVASALALPLTVVIPRSLHPERRRALLDYGARLLPVDDALGLSGAESRAAEEAGKTCAVLVDLFRAPGLAEAYAPIGDELLEALGDAPSLTVCGLDLGAIPTGIALGLGGTPLVAVEPEAARIGSGGAFAPHLLGGLAPAPAPVALDPGAVTRFAAVGDEEAWKLAERLSRETGVLAGIASGAVLAAALREAAALGSADTVVAVLPDSGERRFMLADLFP